MKKLISILMTVVLTFTAVSCITVFAESESPSESTALEKAIISNLEKQYKDADEIVLTSFYQLSQTSAIYSYICANKGTAHDEEQTIISDYKYSYKCRDKVYYFEKSASYTLNDAYTSGRISDEQLDEIAKILDLPKVSEDDVLLKIREEITNKFNDYNPNDITFFGVEYLSNDDVLFAYYVENTNSLSVMQEYYLENYRYIIDAGEERFIYADSMIKDIRMAYWCGIIDNIELNEIAEVLSNYFTVYSDSSDVNSDGKTNVDDVTYVQKLISGLADTDSFAVIDVDHDNSTTINDATLIQKYIAGLEYPYVVD